MIRTTLVLSLLLAPVPAGAETVYKSVDEQGNVRYSAEPPPHGVDYEVLDSVPEPDEAAAQEAVERRQKLEEYLDGTGEPGTEPPQSGGDAVTRETGSAAVMADWRERKKEERRRAFWGEQWPIHHPRHR